MKLYRNSYRGDDDEHGGYTFHASLREAKKHRADFMKLAASGQCERICNIECIEIEPGKAGILKALNRYAGHADNGGTA